ncbi:Flp family type IVb pilin [Thermaerobacter sp. PB12/4term]|uniref:Flp family type IVb pilin n=1 Tax=Thermaerobacter sp. PB12/4term TaxID=2293838 RepID=UPI001FADCE9B|nr:Flp family type IVb pilin [Thermaerobacter sp. PB12/4term]
MAMRTLPAWLGRIRWWRKPGVRRGGQEGAASAEYALLLALVVIVLITALTDLGAAIQARLEGITDALTGAGG